MAAGCLEAGIGLDQQAGADRPVLLEEFAVKGLRSRIVRLGDCQVDQPRRGLLRAFGRCPVEQAGSGLGDAVQIEEAGDVGAQRSVHQHEDMFRGIRPEKRIDQTDRSGGQGVGKHT